LTSFPSYKNLVEQDSRNALSQLRTNHPMSRQIDRTLDILELYATIPDGLSLGEAAMRLSLPKSATHRLLTHLVDRGYLEQDPDSQQYRMTLRLLVIAFGYLTKTGLNDVCQPELNRLAEITNELVRVAVVDNETLTWVAEAQIARTGLRYNGNFGNRPCLWATANGKCWLATMSNEDAIRIVRDQGFGGSLELGPRAIRNIPALIEELERTRERGFAVAYEEAEPGMAGVAVVIPGTRADSPPIGTLSIAGPTVRITRKRLGEFAPELIEVAKRLSELWPIRQYQAGSVKTPGAVRIAVLTTGAS
jgi:DNA-binding IclR family transcriptional regulator